VELLREVRGLNGEAKVLGKDKLTEEMSPPVSDFLY